MSGQFRVDTEKIRNKKSEVDELLTECGKIKKYIEKTGRGRGPVVEELEEISTTMQQAADSLMALLSNTSEYLGKIAGVFDESDEKQANKLTEK